MRGDPVSSSIMLSFVGSLWKAVIRAYPGPPPHRFRETVASPADSQGQRGCCDRLADRGLPICGVRALIRKLGETKTVLLSTHILQEVQAVCDRVVLINESRLVFDGPTDELGDEGTAMEEKFRELTGAAMA